MNGVNKNGGSVHICTIYVLHSHCVTDEKRTHAPRNESNVLQSSNARFSIESYASHANSNRIHGIAVCQIRRRNYISIELNH